MAGHDTVDQGRGLSAMAVLLQIMNRLRDPEMGCPWDLAQSFASIAPYTIEEAYEVADAINRSDWVGLRDELGDLLFQVVFHARMAQEKGHFAFEDVARSVVDKMLRRHPHVFGEESVADADAQSAAWERHKAVERRTEALASGRRHSHLDGVSLALPASTRALKLQSRAARVGFDWASLDGVFAKLHEELGELSEALGEDAPRECVEEELGDLLFTCVNLARHLGHDPETALRRCNAKFEGRFRRMEAVLEDRSRPLALASSEEMEAAWEEVKAGTEDKPSPPGMP